MVTLSGNVIHSQHCNDRQPSKLDLDPEVSTREQQQPGGSDLGLDLPADAHLGKKVSFPQLLSPRIFLESLYGSSEGRTKTQVRETHRDVNM